MFKQVSGIEPQVNGYSFECAWDEKEIDGEQELRKARQACSLDPSDISWSTAAGNKYWIAIAAGIDVSVATVFGNDRSKVKKLRDHLSKYKGWADETKLILDKIDAAGRQLDTAIRLWFSEDDPVSIHVLACSAYQIVDDVNKSKHGPELLYNSLIFKDEHRREAISWIKKEYNFFKHADTDPLATIEFDPSKTPGMMFFASLGLKILGQPLNELREAFATYLGILQPELLEEPLRSQMISALTPKTQKAVFSIPRQSYLEAYPMLKRGLLPK